VNFQPTPSASALSSHSASSKSVTRRGFLSGTAAVAAAGLSSSWLAANPVHVWGKATPEVIIPRDGYELPKLAYGYDALEPYIDAKTMEIHHTRHHQAYINNVNNALKEYPDLAALSPEQLVQSLDKVPETIRTTVRNNGGGHVNHALFWDIMAPGKGGQPTGPLLAAINGTFGSFENFQSTFNQAAGTRFGSGWAWLVQTDSGLAVTSTANQDCPLMDGQTPLLGLDVWEHAYYLHYQNRRADYVTAWWNVVNWDQVAKRFKA